MTPAGRGRAKGGRISQWVSTNHEATMRPQLRKANASRVRGETSRRIWKSLGNGIATLQVAEGAGGSASTTHDQAAQAPRPTSWRLCRRDLRAGGSASRHPLFRRSGAFRKSGRPSRLGLGPHQRSRAAGGAPLQIPRPHHAPGFGYTLISVRRFFSRPSGVALVSMGLSGPLPAVRMRLAG